MVDEFGNYIPDEAPRRNEFQSNYGEPSPALASAEDRADAAYQAVDGGGPNFTQQATQPPVWSQADEIDLQRLMNGKSGARQKYMAGEWGNETFAAMNAQIDAQTAPLLQRKMAARQFAEGQATQAALHANALQQGVRQADMMSAAKGFPGTIHKEYNPDTGGFNTYYQSEPGKWSLRESQPLTLDPIGVGTEESPAEMSPIGATDTNSGENASQRPMGPDGLPLGDEPRFRTIRGDDGTTRQERIPTLAEHELVRQAVGASPGQMDITNGPYTDRYQGGRFVGTNRPAPQQSPDGAGNYYNQARAAFGPEPPQAIPDRFGRPSINPAWVQYNREVLLQARQLQAQEFKQKLADQAIAAKEAQNEAKLKEREKASTPPADLSTLSLGQLSDFALGKGRGHDLVKMIADEEAALAVDGGTVPTDTTINGTVYNPSGVTNPGPWKNVAPDDRHTEAIGRVRRRLSSMLGQSGGKKAEAAPSQAPKEVPAAASLADIRDELERRKNAREFESKKAGRVRKFE